jgi:hypothetical protein
MRQSTLARGLSALTVIGLALCASACSRIEPLPPQTRRTAVLDFDVPSDVAETPLHVRGWWFGARTIFQNPRSGEMFADALARQLHGLNYVDQVPRTDVKYYLTKKRQLLMDKFEALDDAQYEKMISEVSPVDFGEELGAECVLTGRILRAFTSEHRTIHTWKSYVEVEVDVWDIASGQVTWTRRFEGSRRFFSISEVMKRLAKEVASELDRTYFQAADGSQQQPVE